VSNFNPRRERGRRSVVAFGFTRADARQITITDRRRAASLLNAARPRAVGGRRRVAGDGGTGGPGTVEDPHCRRPVLLVVRGRSRWLGARAFRRIGAASALVWAAFGESRDLLWGRLARAC
jgi:hypothetical protein